MLFESILCRGGKKDEMLVKVKSDQSALTQPTNFIIQPNSMWQGNIFFLQSNLQPFFNYVQLYIQDKVLKYKKYIDRQNLLYNLIN
jgi:hypothetical protein